MSDKQETERVAVPVAPPGSLTGDLAADTDDVATLKQRLGRARERLAFYESFDRIIQENIRRSSELMIEATALHERAEQAAAEHARARATLHQQRAAARRQYSALLGDLQAELERARGALDGIAERVTAALGETADSSGPAGRDEAEPAATQGAGPALSGADSTGVAIPDKVPAPSQATAAPPPATSPAATAAASQSMEPVSLPAAEITARQTVPETQAEPQVVEVLVHGVPTARVAISLQNHLRGLDQVSGVEAREFVEGLLRLQATTIAPIDAADLAGWRDGAGSETIRALPDLLEISLPGATER